MCSRDLFFQRLRRKSIFSHVLANDSALLLFLWVGGLCRARAGPWPPLRAGEGIPGTVLLSLVEVFPSAERRKEMAGTLLFQAQSGQLPCFPDQKARSKGNHNGDLLCRAKALEVPFKGPGQRQRQRPGPVPVSVGEVSGEGNRWRGRWRGEKNRWRGRWRGDSSVKNV